MRFGTATRNLIRAALSVVAMAPLMAMAVDGVVLIDQNKALAGGVTPGDGAGYPVTITQPGSYRLSGNLTLPPGSDGIVITVPNVTIDLNGFTVVGSAGGSPGAGIRYTGPLPATGLAIGNGSINGLFSPLSLGSTWVWGTIYTDGAEVMLKDLYINLGIPGTSAGFYIGAHSTVVNVIAGAYDLYVTTCPSTVVNSVFENVRVVGTRCVVANTATVF